MGNCLKGKSETDKHPGVYKCKKCSALSEDKKHVCDPKKVKDKDEKKGDKKKKK